MTTLIPGYEDKTVILAKVVNRGDRSTTITQLGYQNFGRRRLFSWNRKLKSTGIVEKPGVEHALPYELKPGATWEGVAHQNADIERSAIEEELYMVLFHTQSEEPLKQKIVLGYPWGSA